MRAPDPPRDPIAADPVLAELARVLAATRPVVPPDAARRLDARAARALAPPRRTRPRLSRALIPALGLCACAVLAVAIGLSLRGGPGATPGAGVSSRPGVSAAGDAESAGGAVAAPQSSVGAGRAVERSTSLRLGARPREIDGVATRAAAVATTLGGYVASSSVSGGDSATLELRVPGARLDQAVTRLSQLARVRDLQRSTLDITGELTGARRRVAEVRAERRSLLRRLAAAGTARIADAVRGRLAAADRRLERAQTAVRALRSRSDLATIALEIDAERGGAGAGGGAGWTPGDALHDAVRVLEVAAGVVLVALAVLVPLGLLALPAWLGARRFGRRRRERALGPA
jgi:hypothetical protein